MVTVIPFFFFFFFKVKNWNSTKCNFQHVSISACSIIQCSVMSNSLLPLNYHPPASTVHRIFQVRILEWVTISYSRGSSKSRDQAYVSFIYCTGKQFPYHHAIWKALNTQLQRKELKSQIRSTRLQPGAHLYISFPWGIIDIQYCASFTCAA